MTTTVIRAGSSTRVEVTGDQGPRGFVGPVGPASTVPGPQGSIGPTGLQGPPGPDTQAALGRIAQFVPANSTNTALADPTLSGVVNAALADANVSGVMIGAGAVNIARAIVVPSGKFLKGAGRGATTLTRIDNIAGAEFLDRALTRFAQGAIGGYISDMTLIAPKTGIKVQAVWMITNKYCVAERLICYNMGYAYFAQEASQYCVFRDVQSYNANVHFETTAASDILFEYMVSGDGDGDNPLGCEAVWHTLFGSKRITFRHGRHKGKGQSFLVVADSGAGDAGFIDEILFEDCLTVGGSGGSTQIFMSKINDTASVGRVTLRNCDITAPGIAAIVQVGQLTVEGGRVSTTSQEVFVSSGGTSITSKNVDVFVDSPEGAGGFVYNATNAPIVVTGGSITTSSTTVEAGLGAYLSISPETRIVTPNKLYTPVVGRSVSYVYPVDVPLPSGTEVIGTGTTQPKAIIGTLSGGRYRLRFAGKMKKTGSDGIIRFYDDSLSLANTYGWVESENADGTLKRGLNVGDIGSTPRTTQNDVPVNAVRNIAMDITFISNGNTIALIFGTDGVTLLAGARIEISRLS